MKDKIQVPIIVRLQGTNSIEAKKIIDSSGLQIYSATSFSDLTDRIKEALV
jgi:succinyl-CoA synthetase beta subunit